ncbi:MAG: murein L,D-transpeptidase [Thermodesulfobacteriota bacterium]
MLLILSIIAIGCVPSGQENTPNKISTSPHSPETMLDRVSGIIRQRLSSHKTPRATRIGSENIKVYSSLPALYQKQSYKPVWINEDGPISETIVMVEAIRRSYKEGLNPENYYLKEIEDTLARIKTWSKSGKLPSPELLAELDLLLSNSFLKYANDLLYGQVSAQQIDLELVFGEKPVDLNAPLLTAVSENKIDKTLAGLLPKYPVYGRLRTALEQYRLYEAEGGWKPIPEGPKLSKGMRGRGVTALKERLVVTGELNSSDLKNDVYDEALEQAVRKYQDTNGLYVDGVAGDSTIESLNVPAGDLVKHITLSMERWRMLPQDMGNKFVLVNIANYHLYAVENNRDAIEMRIVVGKPKWNTPIFSEEMTNIVINPYWNIPPSIFKDDIAPLIKSDPDYMADRNIQALGLGMEQPNTTDEAEVASAKEAYINKVLTGNYPLRQNPGPSNPLGRIKFLFPNKYSVYLHDTPNRGYFQRSQRNFSHGCIRVEKPVELAEFVLSSDPRWTIERIQSMIGSGKTQTVQLPVQIPVYILYFTAWANRDGSISFHKDVYGLDQVLQNALLQSEAGRTDIAASRIQ